MARHTRFQHPLHLLRRQWPTRDEWRDYKALSKQVLLVIVGFVMLCLMVAFAFELPLLLQ